MVIKFILKITKYIDETNKNVITKNLFLLASLSIYVLLYKKAVIVIKLTTNKNKLAKKSK